MADYATNIRQITESQLDKEVTANQDFDAASPSMLFGRDGPACTGLTFGYLGGRFGGTAFANGTKDATASSTNYLVAHRGTLAVSISTSDTNWNDTVTYGRMYKLTAGSATITGYEDHRAGPGGILGEAALATQTANTVYAGPTSGGAAVPSFRALVAADLPVLPCVIQGACSDETTALVAGTGKLTFRMPHAMTLTEVRASLTTASSSGAVAIDINEAGVSILSTTITVDQGEKTSTTAATPPTISDTALADDAEISIDIDSAGTGATGLKITLIGTRSA
jgi:hypothetical protein